MTQLKPKSDDDQILQQTIQREWFISNGIGGFASSTVCDIHTRRYHGLLMAALTPPTGRTLLLSKLDMSVNYKGRHYPLFSNEFADGTIDPGGYSYLLSFQLDKGMPVWRYAVADALIEKRIVMQPGSNTTLVNLKILRASDSLNFTLTPLCTYRDYHNHSHGGWSLQVNELAYGFEVYAFAGACRYRVYCKQAKYVADPDWYWQFKHRTETARGLDDCEDLFRPGYFSLALHEGEQATTVVSDQVSTSIDFESVVNQIHSEQQLLLQTLPVNVPDWIRQLVLAANQFVVERYQNGLASGKTIIAGYPWFTDWGRDTMIALPGLTLALGRFEIAASILRTFARYTSKGMLPNRFPDQDLTPEYNSVDSTLWFFQAIDQYTLYSGDSSLAIELYPVLSEIIDWYYKGTRYGISVDLQDQLLMAGEPGVQLTWMDAKVDDWVVTPRIGKCVEINALWYNAIQVMFQLANQLGYTEQSEKYHHYALEIKNSFQRFWNTDKQYLYDVIDGLEGNCHNDGKRYDSRLRPNQLFAVSLPYSPLTTIQQKAVVDCCNNHLLTPYGMRSLASNEPGYAPYYQGNPRQRDGAYHQGTVWSWLIGPFIDAHYRVYGDADQALSFLQSFPQHLDTACMGQVNEIFDAEPPFKPRGCFAQAWSVGEVLLIWLKYQKISAM